MSWVKLINKSQKLRTIAPATVTTTPAAISATPLVENAEAYAQVLLKASSTNAGIIYVGDSTVTTSNGYPLSASNTLELRIGDPNDLWAVGSAGSQTLYIAIV